LGLLSRIGTSFGSLSRLQRELLFLGTGLVLGLLVIPAIIWLGGTLVLGPYAGGGTIFSLIANFFKALVNGAPAFWLVALGPYVLILVARLLAATLRRPGAANKEAATQTPAPAKRQAAPPPQATGAKRAPPTRTAPTLSAEPPRPAEPQRRPPAPPNRSSPQPQQPSGGRRTPFIKSID
jgi:hypothetical protein